MGKERLMAFTDAVLAIVMTILVLELEKPEAATFEALWALKENFFAYALSFFWLGTMWVNLHNEWHDVSKVTIAVVWWSVIELFFLFADTIRDSFCQCGLQQRRDTGFLCNHGAA